MVDMTEIVPRVYPCTVSAYLDGDRHARDAFYRLGETLHDLDRPGLEVERVSGEAVPGIVEH